MRVQYYVTRSSDLTLEMREERMKRADSNYLHDDRAKWLTCLTENTVSEDLNPSRFTWCIPKYVSQTLITCCLPPEHANSPACFDMSRLPLSRLPDKIALWMSSFVKHERLNK